MKPATVLVLSLVGWLAASTVGAAIDNAPQLISPGYGRADARVGTLCPTFTWTTSPQAVGYTVVVYPARAATAPSSPPLVEIDLPAGASSWVPTLDECLPTAGRYAWSVAARGADGALRWSTPGVFRVEMAATVAGPAPTGAMAPTPSPLPAPADAKQASRQPASQVTAAAYTPACLGDVFFDVDSANPLCSWVEQLERDGISEGCGGGNYCPKQPVTRDQLALYLERAMRGTDRWNPRAGAAWTPPAPPTVTAVDPSIGFQLAMTTGADGLPLVIYYPFSDNTLTIAHCGDLACSLVTTTTPIHPAGGDPAIGIGSDGLALFTFEVSSGGGTSNILNIAHCNDIQCSSFTSITPDPAAYVPYPAAITVGADGLALVAYADWNAETENVARCADLVCSSAPAHPIRTSVVDATVAAATGIDGFGFFVYGEWSPGYTLVAARCADAACSTASFNPINTGDVVGDRHSVAIGTDGLPVVAFTRSTDLGVAHCTDLACSSSVFTMLDTVGSVGDYNATAIGADGLAVISYVDGTNVAVKVAHCSDYKCSAATTTQLDGISVSWTAIAIGGDGLPVVAYRGSTGALEIAHCSNVLCQAFFVHR